MDTPGDFPMDLNGPEIWLLVGKCLMNTYLLPKIMLGPSQDLQYYWGDNIHTYTELSSAKMIYHQGLHCVVQPGGFAEEMDLKLALKEGRIQIGEK